MRLCASESVCARQRGRAEGATREYSEVRRWTLLVSVTTRLALLASRSLVETEGVLDLEQMQIFLKSAHV